MNSILQWNCNGFYRHKEELDKLINDFNPSCICLQETHFKGTDKGVLNGFNVVRYDDTSGQRAHGGVMIATKETLYTSRVVLNTPFQAVAVSFHGSQSVTICNVYLPEGMLVTPLNLEALISQLPKPFIMVGDFNAHDTLWGSSMAQCNRRGRILARVLTDSNLVLLNDGTKTRFNSFNGSYSTIDLCFTTSTLMDKFHMKVHDDLCGSDHFPIFIDRGDDSNPDIIRPGSWSIRKADW